MQQPCSLLHDQVASFVVNLGVNLEGQSASAARGQEKSHLRSVLRAVCTVLPLEKQERVQRSLAQRSGADSVRKKTQDEARVGVWVKGEAEVMMDDNDPAQANLQVLFRLGPGQPDAPHVSHDDTPGVGQGRSTSVVGNSPSVRRPTWRSPRCTQA